MLDINFHWLIEYISLRFLLGILISNIPKFVEVLRYGYRAIYRQRMTLFIITKT